MGWARSSPSSPTSTFTSRAGRRPAPSVRGQRAIAGMPARITLDDMAEWRRARPGDGDHMDQTLAQEFAPRLM